MGVILDFEITKQTREKQYDDSHDYPDC